MRPDAKEKQFEREITYYTGPSMRDAYRPEALSCHQLVLVVGDRPILGRIRCSHGDIHRPAHWRGAFQLMSHAVWTYNLKATTVQEIEMPWGAKVLKLAVAADTICLWALVDTAQTGRTTKEFRFYESDELIPDANQLTYVGSLATGSDDKPVVIHCFEALRVVL